MNRLCLAAAIAALSFTVAVHAADEGKPLPLEKAPAAVQAAVKQQLGAAKLEGLATEDEDGKTVYVAEYFDAKEAGHFTTFDAGGKRLKQEDDLPLSEVPMACRAAVKAKQPNGKPDDTATKITDADGTVTYQIDVTVNGKAREIVVGTDGKIVADDEAEDDAKPTTKPAAG